MEEDAWLGFKGTCFRGSREKRWVWGASVCVSQSCLTLSNPMDCSPLGSSVLWILQARIPEWVAISSSRGSSRPRNPAGVSCICWLYLCATWEVLGKPEDHSRGDVPGSAL